jgi:NTP pyrophosphatase (non-canonical NTP hydrolase)
MNGDKYSKESGVTDLDVEGYDKVLARLGDPKLARLIHASMGLTTEAGEFVDMLKKHLFYGKAVDETNLVEELGDQLWYIALALRTLGSSFEDAMERNIKKLRTRYPNKFEERRALERDLDAERAALEVKSL